MLRGTVKGGRRQGRQRTRWDDNIREWTGLEFAKSQRAVENREKWRKLVAKSSVVPQRPSRLRDGWERWEKLLQRDQGRDRTATVVHTSHVIHWSFWEAGEKRERREEGVYGCRAVWTGLQCLAIQMPADADTSIIYPDFQRPQKG